MIRRDQARGEGLSDRQLRLRQASGSWEELYPGVFRIEGAPRTWRQELMALSLWARRGFAISHRSAAALLGFSRYQEGSLELILTRRARAPQGARIHRADRLAHHELTTVDGLCVTSPTRTLVDLSSTEPRAALRASVEEALRRRWTTVERLETAVGRAASRRGVRALSALVQEQAGGLGPTESELEARVLELLEAHDLPRPVQQQALRAGGRLRRLDFRIPGTPVVIEADGYAHHAGLDEFERDRARRNALTARGLLVLHWTWAAVHHRPEELIAQLRAALAR